MPLLTVPEIVDIRPPRRGQLSHRRWPSYNLIIRSKEARRRASTTPNSGRICRHGAKSAKASVVPEAQLPDLVDYLARTSRLAHSSAARLVDTIGGAER